MLCLGIESSCDDTSLAFVDNGVIKGQCSVSQTNIHALFGGVVPEIASREHARSIGLLYDALLKQSSTTAKDIAAIAVARGPGLLGSLLVGVSFAKALSIGLDIPFIGVNHLHAHLIAAGIENTLVFPAIGLLVSGGHTHLYRIEKENKFTLLGRTLDDAAGEAFDKAGKMLGMPYPAGHLIDKLTKEATSVDNKLFPRPYLDNQNLDFSFSGLKTSMALRVREKQVETVHFNEEGGDLTFVSDEQKISIANLCASYSNAIVDTLVEKTRRAILQNTDAKMVILAGGVASNSLLRNAMEELADVHNKLFAVPSPSFCTDNGAMVAYLGEKLITAGFSHALSMPAIPRGKIVPDDYRY